MKEDYHTVGCVVEILRREFREQGEMAETEVVTRFKAFARDRLLAALREADGTDLHKEPTYNAIREAFAAEHGWSGELEEVEPGPTHTPRWRNRLHWVVAELVQTGVLEPSERRDTLHPTPFGRDLLRLPAPFRDTPQTRLLIEALQSTEPDKQQAAEAERLLAEFRGRFPPEMLADMTLEEYALGGGDRENFCWWLERGLQDLGRYAPGSSRNHLIYKAKNGEVIRIRSLRNLTPNEAMSRVARWHADVVAAGANLAPEQIDAETIDILGMSRTLKLLNSYYPDRFLPINSVEHLRRFLVEFGVPESEIPKGPVARNCLLLKLFQAVGQPHGLSPWDFMRLLYARFDPKPVQLDETRLRGAMRLFRWLYGEAGFKAPRFIEEERGYKDEVALRWRTAAEPEGLLRALGAGREVETARGLAAALLAPPSNLLNYRYAAAIQGLERAEESRLFVEAVVELLGSGEDDEAVPDVGRFNERMGPLYDRIDAGGREAASRSIPTLILMLSFPERDVFVRSDLFHRARQALAKKAAFEDEGSFGTGGYRDHRAFAETVRDAIDELGPADMIDVQGFLWAVFGKSELWFGGVSYRDAGGRHIDMFARFREQDVYAVGYGRDPAIRDLISGAAKLRADERRERTREIGRLAASDAEGKAVAAFVELAARPGGIVIAKSTFYQQQSILRLRGAAVVRGDVGFDPELGHTVAVEWREPVEVRLALGKAFAKLAGTLVALKLADALNVLGAEEARQPADREGEEATHAVEPPSPALARPELPKNLILYGPPGTGKTWEVLENIRPHFGERVEMITFHPNFAYEEFVEGLRPITDETVGHVRYQVVPGVFRRVCNEALAHAELPHLLIIDEINRANLAAVFGELITLIEEDKRDKGNVTLPYSKERFTVPGNLWIVGTMNTADRSIALMDVALRRRFVFREVSVDYTVLTNDFAEATDPLLVDLDLAAILQALNQRLRLLVDREHQIGHAWLMGVRSLDDLRERFANRILPLLAEYFFDDWSRICLVLGEDPLTSRETDLVRKTILPVAGQQRLFGRIVRDGGPVVLYDPGEPAGWTVEHFAKIVPLPEMEPEAEK